MKNFALITAVVLIALSATAQKKERRTYGVEKMTEFTVKYKDGKEEERYISDVEFYNEDGKWIEKVDYLPNGQIKRIEKRKYAKIDWFGEKEIVEEIVDEPLDRGVEEKKLKPDYKREVYTYEKGEVVREDEYNREGELKGWKTFEYNGYGDVLEEREYKADGELKEYEKYTYDKRGLPLKRQTFKASGELEEEKIYVYE
ncbi:MAG: hypothetical protein ABR574_00785 [Cryomorphaceae bacterium]|nr:hypothetical protein [Flavobacteriales bacterium]